MDAAAAVRFAFPQNHSTFALCLCVAGTSAISTGNFEAHLYFSGGQRFD
jgi:hypothetical protein